MGGSTGVDVNSMTTIPLEDLTEAQQNMNSNNYLLRPADRGRHAWLFLFASFLIEGCTLGFLGAFGVFHEYYSTHEPFRNASGIPAVATCASGILFLGMPVMMGVQRIYPRLTTWFPITGILVMSLSLITASVVITVPYLIVTQGMLFAIGSSLSYCACIAYLSQWFNKRKGVAYGVMHTGTGLFGSVLPFALRYLLNHLGHRTTLQICGASIALINLPFICVIQPRIPPQAMKGDIRLCDFTFTIRRAFLLHQLANIIHALGYFLPFVYLPTYARLVLHVGEFPAAGTLCLVNLASVAGCPIMGWLSDRLHVTTCLSIATIGAAIATFLLWGFATNLPALFAYCVLYGLFASSYSTAWTGLMRQFAANPISSSHGSVPTDPAIVMAALAAGRGFGILLSGPLSEVLIANRQWAHEPLTAYASQYSAIILFTGSTAAVGGLVLPWRYMDLLP